MLRQLMKLIISRVSRSGGGGNFADSSIHEPLQLSNGTADVDVIQAIIPMSMLARQWVKPAGDT